MLVAGWCNDKQVKGLNPVFILTSSEPEEEAKISLSVDLKNRSKLLLRGLNTKTKQARYETLVKL